MDVALIFPNQLFWPHPAIAPGRSIFLVEDPLFFGGDARWPANMHRQKLLLHRASMQAFAVRVRQEGVKVEILTAQGPGATTGRILEAGVPRSASALHWVDPVDDVLSGRLKKFSESRNLPAHVYETPQFLTPPAFLDECFGGARKPFMARFYERQRRRMNILVSDDGEPLGGQWSFDSDNRKRLPRDVVVPAVPAVRQDFPSLAGGVVADFPGSLGQEVPFGYPVTHEAAEKWLDEFLKIRLGGFGAYEDAISVRHTVLFHSVLTPALNIGLLTPEQVVNKTLAYASSRRVPLNSLEGFLRQIIGWREFVRAMYERYGRRMRTTNFWGFERRMPRAFYDATTGIEPVDHVIRGVLATGYCHHIERLMVLGNFLLLCRVHPDDVYLWFMEMFIDSYDWVMVPNVYGMSQYADGGIFTTKPYISGSNYVLKMSDFRRGPWCEIWDALFWTFVADQRDFFLRNPRLAMMARLSDKRGEAMAGPRRVAEKFLAKLEMT